MDHKEHTHPSYALVSVGSAQVSPAVNLYGSAVKHSNIITLSISKSRKVRSLGNNHYWADGGPIIELSMSRTQFADMITSMNQGVGVPATFRLLEGKYVEQCPEDDVIKEHQDEFKEKLKIHVESIKRKKQIANEIIEKKTLNKADQELLKELLNEITKFGEDSVTFYDKQFTRKMESTVSEAKSAIEAHAASLGLMNNNPQLSIGDTAQLLLESDNSNGEA